MDRSCVLFIERCEPFYGFGTQFDKTQPTQLTVPIWVLAKTSQ